MQYRFFLLSLKKVCAWTMFACSIGFLQTAMATTEAATQYAADKRLCAAESSNVARLQCRRDAKAAYDTARTEAPSEMVATPKPELGNDACPHCAKVVAVNIVEKEGQGSAIGMIAGGVGGAILGHQVGGGVGKDLATIAGAAGGAYVGKKIEGKVRSYKIWTVVVQYPDGRKKHVEFKKDPGYKVGDAVKDSGSSISRR